MSFLNIVAWKKVLKAVSAGTKVMSRPHSNSVHVMLRSTMYKIIMRSWHHLCTCLDSLNTKQVVPCKNIKEFPDQQLMHNQQSNNSSTCHMIDAEPPSLPAWSRCSSILSPRSVSALDWTWHWSKSASSMLESEGGVQPSIRTQGGMIMLPDRSTREEE